MNKQHIQKGQHEQAKWWVGLTDIVTMGAVHTAAVAERMHIAIADETFQVLNAVPVVRMVSQPAQRMHHGIARFCYSGVGLASIATNHLIQFAVRISR